ncbi:MAG: acyl carrier protein [Polyangiales bacterium]
MLKALARAAKRSVSVDDTTPIRALGLDSLGLMVLFADFCQSYAIDMQAVDPGAVAVVTVGDLVGAAEALAARAS